MSSGTPGLRRIARLPEAQEREQNQFWRDNETALNQICTPSEVTSNPAPILARIYTSRRLCPYDATTLSSLLAVLPQSVVDCAQQVSDGLGVAEADVLKWLLSGSHHCLSLVGARGCGKSTLLHFLFRSMVTQCDELARFVPVIYDVREEAHKYPSEFDILTGLVRAAARTLVEFGNKDDSAIAESVEDPARALIDAFVPASLPRYDDGGRIAHSSFDYAIGGLVAHLARTGRRLCIIFDNSDQLSSNSVALLLGLSRSLTLRHGVRVVMAMRPFNLRGQIEHSHHVSGFIRCSVHVFPPELGALLRRRTLHYLEQHPEHRSYWVQSGRSGDIGVEFSGLDDLIGRVATATFPLPVQRSLTEQLFNGDVRQTLRAFRNLLRWSGLPIRVIGSRVVAGPWADTHDSRQWLRYILQGMLLDDYRYYREETSSGRHVIMNLFDVGKECTEADYTVQYHALQYLQWRNGMVFSEECIHFLAALGHSRLASERALERCICFGLASSPEHDSEVARTTNVAITATGVNYLCNLASNADYLYHVVMDALLHHGNWIARAEEWTSRMESLLELANAVIESEQKSVEKCGSKLWAARALEPYGLLSSRLCDGIKELDFQARHSHKRGVSTAVGHLADAIAALDARVRHVTEALRALVERAAVTEVSVGTRHVSELSGGGHISVVVPRLGVGEEGILEMEVYAPEPLRKKRVTLYCELDRCSTETRSPCFVDLDSGSEPRRARLLICARGDRVHGRLWLTCGARLVSVLPLPESVDTGETVVVGGR